MLERDIEKKVSEFAKRQGWLTYKWSSPAHRGVPDRIYLRNGVIRLVEFKAPGKLPTKLQAHEHTKLLEHGFPVVIIDNIEEGKRLFH